MATNPNWDEIFVSVIPDGSADDLKKWTRRCLDNGSSFAVVDGRLYLSQASQDLIIQNKPLPKVTNEKPYSDRQENRS